MTIDISKLFANNTSSKDHSEKEGMNELEVKQMSQMLKDSHRCNVWVNKFDRTKPYRVSIKLKQDGKTKKEPEYTNHGVFECIETASLIGSLVAKAEYQDKAIVGEFNAEVAQASSEWSSWIVDPRNKEVLSKLG